MAQAELTLRIDGEVETVTAYGEIRGRAEMASVHKRDYVTVYESVHGWPVRCFPQQADWNDLRQALGVTVVVTGRVRRNLETRRPVDVRDAVIAPAQIVEADAWRKAIGLVPVAPDGLSAEDAIRRFRNGR